jgi:hypothetical protein
MQAEVANLLMLAEQERALAQVETDPLKRSHHEEFAARYSAQASLLKLDSEEAYSSNLKRWIRCRTGLLRRYSFQLLRQARYSRSAKATHI